MAIKRQEYLDSILRFRDAPLIKILAGIRRCGKSTLFELLAEEFRDEGIPEDTDHYPKYVLTTERLDIGIEEGIRIVHIADFLLADW